MDYQKIVDTTQNHAIIISNNSFDKDALRNCEQNASKLSSFLRSKFSFDSVVTLINEQATCPSIDYQIRSLMEKVKHQPEFLHQFIFYFGGFGDLDGRLGTFDYNLGNSNKRTFLRFLAPLIEANLFRHVLVVLDRYNQEDEIPIKNSLSRSYELPEFKGGKEGPISQVMNSRSIQTITHQFSDPKSQLLTDWLIKAFNSADFTWNDSKNTAGWCTTKQLAYKISDIAHYERSESRPRFYSDFDGQFVFMRKGGQGQDQTADQQTSSWTTFRRVLFFLACCSPWITLGKFQSLSLQDGWPMLLLVGLLTYQMPNTLKNGNKINPWKATLISVFKRKIVLGLLAMCIGLHTLNLSNSLYLYSAAAMFLGFTLCTFFNQIIIQKPSKSYTASLLVLGVFFLVIAGMMAIMAYLNVDIILSRDVSIFNFSDRMLLLMFATLYLLMQMWSGLIISFELTLKAIQPLNNYSSRTFINGADCWY
jgi:hypothetical protein